MGRKRVQTPSSSDVWVAPLVICVVVVVVVVVVVTVDVVVVVTVDVVVVVGLSCRAFSF